MPSLQKLKELLPNIKELNLPNNDICDDFYNKINNKFSNIKISESISTNNDSKTIAKIIEPEFPDTKLEDLVNAIDQYKKADTWPSTTNFTEESFNHMQDIMINAKQLDKKVNYNDLIYQVK